MQTNSEKKPDGALEHPCRLSPKDCRFLIEEVDFSSSDQHSSDFAIIGQDRAMTAIDLALNIRAKGYNLFISGPPGTGKRTAISHALSALPREPQTLKDICVVQDFNEPESPKPLYFPAGQAAEFRRRLRDFLTNLSAMVAGLSHQPQFRSFRDRIALEAETEEQQLIFDFEGKLTKEGFKIVQTTEDDESLTDILPLINDEVSDFETLQGMVSRGELSETDYTRLRERQMGLVDEMQTIFETLQKRRIDMQKRLDLFRLEIVSPLVNEGLRSIKQDFPLDEAHHFLDQIGMHLLSNESFITHLTEPGELEQEDGGKNGEESPFSRATKSGKRGAWQGAELAEHLRIYDINILVDHQNSRTTPVIFEQYPDFAKLFGSIEILPEALQESQPPHMLLRAGSLVKASGGYLVLRAEDVLRDEDLYITLKRALQESSLEIRPPSGQTQTPQNSIKPKPINLDLKVVMTGPDGLYEALFERDEDFEKLFKIPAEFDSCVDRSPQISRAFCDFFMMSARENKLLVPDRGALAALLEYAVRVAEFRNKLSTRFSLLADILKESDYWARKAGSEAISRSHIAKTLETRKFLYNLPEEKLDEQILSGELLLEVTGTAVGRINGLAVMDRGYYAFGRPMVISAQVAPGDEGVVNVEREVGLSGEIHDKGTFIVESYIRAHYTRDFPLSISASLCFEQSYSEVDGDSASSTEVYTLLSAIGGIPLRQDIAVTGSVNQMGQIQPVGGVVEKIEGFWSVCRKVNFTGTQGVIIPRQNIQNLVLDVRVQKTIEEGSFHIWAIETLDQGMEILTGLPAGTRNSRGKFPADSINGIVERRLRELHGHNEK